MRPSSGPIIADHLLEAAGREDTLGPLQQGLRVGVFDSSSHRLRDIPEFQLQQAQKDRGFTFLPPFHAFFVSNFYHGLQYFAIVWAIENRTIRHAAHLDRMRFGKVAAFVVFCLLLVASGYAYKLWGNDTLRLGVAFFTVVTLMHFWYDSFVWQAHKLKAA